MFVTPIVDAISATWESWNGRLEGLDAAQMRPLM
jgi:hypothetical protein